MRKFFALWAALVLLLTTSAGFAYEPPHRDGFITDTAGKLSSTDEGFIEAKLENYYRTSGNTIAVLILTDMGGGDIKDVAYDTFNKWGVGDKQKDNGVLLVLSIKERKSRIEVGEGAEGLLTDVDSKRILDLTLKPFLRRGNFKGGILASANEISRELTPNRPISKKRVPTKRSHAPPMGHSVPIGTTNHQVVFWGIFIAFVIFIIVYIYVKKNSRGGRHRSSSSSHHDDSHHGGYGGGSSGGSDYGGGDSGGFGGGSSGGGGADGDW